MFICDLIRCNLFFAFTKFGFSVKCTAFYKKNMLECYHGIKFLKQYSLIYIG